MQSGQSGQRRLAADVLWQVFSLDQGLGGLYCLAPVRGHLLVLLVLLTRSEQLQLKALRPVILLKLLKGLYDEIAGLVV